MKPAALIAHNAGVRDKQLTPNRTKGKHMSIQRNPTGACLLANYSPNVILYSDMVKPRPKLFLEKLPQNGNVMYKAAIEAGYSKSYAHSKGKIILKNAIKETAKEILEKTESKEITAEAGKQLMCEIIGIDEGMLKNTLKKIALQDKDYSSALKVLSPLSKEAIGLNITGDEQNNTKPSILNVIVSDNKANNKDIIEGERVG